METFDANSQSYIEFIKTDWQSLAIYIAGMLILLWSGCVSSSIAENRLRNPFIHFLVGLCLPVIYPVVILFSMSVYVGKDEKEVKEDPSSKVEGAPPVDMPPAAPEEAVAGAISEDALANQIKYDMEYFKNLAYDSEGNYRGPFLFRVIGGQDIRVERIVDCMLPVVVIESVSSEGKAQRLRLPYEKIESCTEL